MSTANVQDDNAIAIGESAVARVPYAIALGTGVDATREGFYVSPIRDIASDTDKTGNPCALVWGGGTDEILYDCSITRRRLSEEKDYEATIAALEARLKSLEEKMDALLR